MEAKRNKKGSRGPQKRWKGGRRRPPLNPDTRLHRRDCSIGVKTNSQGHQQSWREYKLHLDVADGQIPISAVLTGAKVHDSQVAIPLATMSTQRVTYCYELMDAAMMRKRFANITRPWDTS